MNSAYRQMYLLSRLTERVPMSKTELAEHFGVSARTIQRDVSQLNHFFDQENVTQFIRYDATARNYVLNSGGQHLSDRQLLVIIKIVLATRGLALPEMHALIDGLRELVTPEQKMVVDRMVLNERQNFMPLHHGQALIDLIWDFSTYIQAQRTVAISYTDRVHTASQREIIPKAIFFSESYFYVIATDLASKMTRFFRADRIQHYHRTKAAPVGSTHNQFDEGDLRKHIQFMYAGEMETIKFEFWGIVEAALDRLPTARVIETREHSVIIEAKVFGQGVQMWLLSQGNMVRVLEPQSLVEKMIKSTQETLALYAGQLGAGSDVPHFNI